jgi:hypothetical protein
MNEAAQRLADDLLHRYEGVWAAGSSGHRRYAHKLAGGAQALDRSTGPPAGDEAQARHASGLFLLQREAATQQAQARPRLVFSMGRERRPAA